MFSSGPKGHGQRLFLGSIDSSMPRAVDRTENGGGSGEKIWKVSIVTRNPHEGVKGALTTSSI